MAFRVVMIENEVSIRLKLNNLVITKEGNDIWIPIDDISILVLDNLTINISVRTMCILAEKGVEVIICNMEHLPIGSYGAYNNHSRSSKILGFQINNDKTFYDILWKQIIEAKIKNQREVLEILHKDEATVLKLKEFEFNIEAGDSTNREAHAAKVYFNTLMDSSFSRGNDNILLNSGLDYGYSIIRSYISRFCVGYGLNTQIGIHHKNEYNRFNLVDDIMEPIRPFIDITAYTLLDGEEYFKAEHRHELVNIVNQKVRYRGKIMYLGNAIEDYIEQIAAFIQGKSDNIIYPEISNYQREDINEI